LIQDVFLTLKFSSKHLKPLICLMESYARAHPSQELFRIHRFAEKVVSTAVEPDHTILHPRSRGEQDEVGSFEELIGLDLSAHFQAIHAVHQPITENQRGRIAAGFLQRTFTRIGNPDAVPLVSQPAFQNSGMDTVIIH